MAIEALNFIGWTLAQRRLPQRHSQGLKRPSAMTTAPVKYTRML